MARMTAWNDTESATSKSPASIETHLCRLCVAAEKSPLNVSTITEIRRVRRLGRESQDALNERLRRFGLLKEELDDRGEGLELNLRREMDVSGAPYARTRDSEIGRAHV